MVPHLQDLTQMTTQDERMTAKTPYRRKYRTYLILSLGMVHGLSFYALIFHLQHLKLWTLIYALALTVFGMLGVTAGAHRLWAHRTYKATWPLRVFLLFCYSLSCHMSLYNWVQTHRLHHKYSDTDADPHNSRRGFFFSHIGWLLMEKNSACSKEIKSIDMSDILEDPIAVFYSRVFYPVSYAQFLLPSLVPVYFWGDDLFISFLFASIIRLLCIFHMSASINSVAHMFGLRPYNKHIRPTESPLFSFFSLGEGWHNYHHTFPWDYKAAEFGDRINVTARFLDLCAKLGLAYDLKTVSPDVVARTKKE